MLKEPLLEQNNLKAYIPNYLMYKFGVIWNVLSDISEEDILKEIKSDIKVIQARRLKMKYIKDNETQWIDSYSVVLKFEGQCLLNHVYTYIF